MEWYDGTVTEALSSYQEKNGIIIVYIHHPVDVNNESTTKFNELWETFDKKLLKDIPAVSIRLTSDSEGAVQFAQFFPTPIFPVCYIIGLNGQPLEVITPAEDLSVTRLNESLKKSINLYRDQLREKGLASNSSTSSAKVDVAGAESKGDQPTASAGSPEPPNMTLEERIQYARERLEEKRRADAIKKEEEQRQKEIERRNEGKSMLDAREKQKERELREAIEKRKREKEADNQALKALREQIKRDKEERARKAAGAGISEKVDEPEQKTSRPEPEFNKPVDVEECRIQCRFSDGKTLVKTFPSKGPLQAVVDAVKEDGRQPGEFFLVQAYPRRQLKELDKTLLELGLTPSSTLLVISKEDKQSKRLLPSSTGGSSYLNLLFGFLYAHFVAVLRFIGGIFNFGGAPAVAAPNAPGASENNGRNSSAANSQQRKEAKESVRRDGNIGRLRNESDSSDNEGTWNGNSTQQL